MPQISAGVTHSAALTQDGEVFVWGCGREGQLGLGHLNSPRVPQCIQSLLSHVVVQVECGEFHTVALTESKLVFSWGDGAYGQLGHPEKADDPEQELVVLAPRLVEAFNETSDVIVQVAVAMLSKPSMKHLIDVAPGELW